MLQFVSGLAIIWNTIIIICEYSQIHIKFID